MLCGSRTVPEISRCRLGPRSAGRWITTCLSLFRIIKLPFDFCLSALREPNYTAPSMTKCLSLAEVGAYILALTASISSPRTERRRTAPKNQIDKSSSSNGDWKPRPFYASTIAGVVLAKRSTGMPEPAVAERGAREVSDRSRRPCSRLLILADCRRDASATAFRVSPWQCRRRCRTSLH